MTENSPDFVEAKRLFTQYAEKELGTDESNLTIRTQKMLNQHPVYFFSAEVKGSNKSRFPWENILSGGVANGEIVGYGIPGSFERCMKVIDIFHNRSVDVAKVARIYGKLTFPVDAYMSVVIDPKYDLPQWMSVDDSEMTFPPRLTDEGESLLFELWCFFGHSKEVELHQIRMNSKNEVEVCVKRHP
jgi:hypothetical protein